MIKRLGMGRLGRNSYLNDVTYSFGDVMANIMLVSSQQLRRTDLFYLMNMLKELRMLKKVWVTHARNRDLESELYAINPDVIMFLDKGAAKSFGFTRKIIPTSPMLRYSCIPYQYTSAVVTIENVYDYLKTNLVWARTVGKKYKEIGGAP